MVKFGLELVPMDPYWKTVYYAILAEKLGFDYVWITDHYVNRNVYTILTTIALHTERIKMGAGVTNPYLIHPVVTAQIFASLNEIAPGRVVCGIGPGDKTTLESVITSYEKPLLTVKEAVQIIRSVITTGKVKFEGSRFVVPNVRMNFKPKQNIPIFIGAQGPKMLSLAAELGDGVMINASHPKDFEIALQCLKDGVTKAGRRLEDIEITAATSVSIAEDMEKARKAALPIVAFIVAGCPPNILESHGIKPESAQAIKDAINKGQWKEAFGQVTTEMLDSFSIYGTPEVCIEKIDKIVKLGVTLLVVGSPVGPDVRKSLMLISKEVMPRFKA
ncbi:MAG: 5,10-methylenetetrahydromethanopterin reductase [Nitrososphaerales archaeon]|nr:5,10-methylenetetrahydromethanopterin reductase [Nitrososphaerales archaeon]